MSLLLIPRFSNSCTYLSAIFYSFSHSKHHTVFFSYYETVKNTIPYHTISEITFNNLIVSTTQHKLINIVSPLLQLTFSDCFDAHAQYSPSYAGAVTCEIQNFNHMLAKTLTDPVKLIKLKSGFLMII